MHLWSLFESCPHTSKQQIPGSRMFMLSYSVWSNWLVRQLHHRSRTVQVSLYNKCQHVEPLSVYLLPVCPQSVHGSVFHCGSGGWREAHAAQQTHPATLSAGRDLWPRRPALGADGLWWCTAADLHTQTGLLGGTVWYTSTSLDSYSNDFLHISS